MAILNSGLAKSSAADAYTIDNSVRIEKGSGLSKTIAGDGNKTTWTWSGWTKNAFDWSSTLDNVLFSALHTSGAGSGRFLAYFRGEADQYFEINQYQGSYSTQMATNAVYRDPGAWLHVVVVWDTDNGVTADNARIWINGERITSFRTENLPSDGEASSINEADCTQAVGFGTWDTTDTGIDSYLAEVYFIDGQALDADSFGELDSTTNQWVPIDASGLTFGTNGFYQKYGGTELADSFTWSAPGDGNRAGVSVSGAGAGGGGAGGAGGTATTSNGGDGGSGKLYSSFTSYGVSGYFGGGGGGGVGSGTAGAAGSGGGAAGSNSTTGPTATANTGGGGGGGGGGSASNGGAGGSGTVLVKDTDGTYTEFTSSGDYTVPAGITSVEVLIVAGGAGGGANNNTGGGGGGAGGIKHFESYTVTPSATIAVVVGTGGAGGPTNGPGVKGLDSSFDGVSVVGGAPGSYGGVGDPGGSGGGPGGQSAATGNVSIYSVTPEGDTTNTRAQRKIGDSSIYFDGTGDYLSIPNSSDFDFGSGALTIECWARFPSVPTGGGTYGLFNYATSSGSSVGGSGWNMDLEDISGTLNLRWQFWDDGTPSNRTGHQPWTPSLNTWYHIAVVRNGDVFTTYIDGSSIGATTLAYTIGDFLGTKGLFVGVNRDGSYNPNTPLTGYLDEIRISNVARYTTTFTPSTTAFTADANTKLLIHSNWDGGLGADSSGNYNTFTATNLVATDQMIDTPTNNFCTMNPLDNYYAGATFTEGNLKQSIPSANDTFTTSTFASASGKWYCEFYVTTGTTTSAIGISSPPSASSTYPLGGGAYAYGYLATGDKSHDSSSSSYGSTWTTGDIMAIALDLDNNKLYFAKNNTWQDSGDPTSGATGTGAISILAPSAVSFSNNYLICAGHNTTGADSVFVANFGQDSSFAGAKTAQGNSDGGTATTDFYYTPPSGYLALCSDNLSDPEIALPGEHFNTVLYTGNSGVSQAITGVGFQPDFLWLKGRAVAHSHFLATSVGGVDNSLRSSEAGVYETYDGLDSFDSDGFTLGTWTRVNAGSDTYVSWSWKAGGAPTADNTEAAGATPTAGSVKIDGSNLGSALAGTIAATKLSANTTSGFSIVGWTGNDTSGATVAHGLGVVPDMILTKDLTTAEDWQCYDIDGGPTKYIQLNDAGGYATDSSRWNDGSPAFSTTTFTLGNSVKVNDADDDYIGYCFASIEGYSRVGRYEGNANADGTFIYTGFRPACIITKNVDASNNWHIYDNKRLGYNVDNNALQPNLNDATFTDNDIDIVSNGFKQRRHYSQNNANTYIYIAFAESPFKTSNAR